MVLLAVALLRRTTLIAWTAYITLGFCALVTLGRCSLRRLILLIGVARIVVAIRLTVLRHRESSMDLSLPMLDTTSSVDPEPEHRAWSRQGWEGKALYLAIRGKSDEDRQDWMRLRHCN